MPNAQFTKAKLSVCDLQLEITPVSNASLTTHSIFSVFNMSADSSTSTSFQFTKEAKSNVNQFRKATGLTQPAIINRILEKASIADVKEWCADLIEENESKKEESKIRANQMLELSKLPSDVLQSLIASQQVSA
ncbi:hypothetical protein NMR75_000640 [Vibrio cholerae]|nr:hypothetical protein [Vibrio cholerae]